MAGEIPSWLRGHLDDGHLNRIRQAVKNAEAKTSAEIVPMIVRRSSAIGQVPMVLTLAIAVMALLILLAGREFLTDPEVIGLALAIFPVSFLLGLWLARFDVLQRLTIPNGDEAAQVWRRARIEFGLTRINNTRHRSGVLILVSMMERRAVILPDEGVSAVLNAELCKTLVDRMASHLGRGEWGPAFEGVIGEMSEKLSTALPHGAGGADELANDLRIKE